MVNKILPRRKTAPGAIPAPADMAVGEIASNSADGKLFIKKADNSVVEPGAGGAPPGYLSGLRLSLSASDPDHDIDITAGLVRSMTGAVTIACPAMTKRGDAAWSAGNNGGMLSTGTLRPNTSYYLFAMARGDGTPDYLLYPGTNPSGNLPAGYINYALLHDGQPLKTDSAGNFHDYFHGKWRSENFTYANNRAVRIDCPVLPVLHNLTLWGKCITAHSIFSARDIVLFGTSDSSGSNRGYTIRHAGNTITLHVRTSLIQYTVLNPAHWELFFTAETREA